MMLTSNDMTDQDVDVLIIEDNADDAELAIRALGKYNLNKRLVHLEDGAIALDFIFSRGIYHGRSTNILPKVILLDLKMPKVNGIEVLQKIKSDPRTKMIPVVILTSSAEEPDVRRCYELGANSYIVKPVDYGNFSKTIGEMGLYWLMINKA